MELPNSVTKLQSMVRRYQSTTRHAREKAGELMHTAVTAGVQSVTGFGLGYMSKKAPAAFATTFGAGVPLPLALAAGAYGAAAFGVGRGMEDHVKSVGHAALTAHLFLLGQDTAAGAGSSSSSSSPLPGIPGIPPLRGTGITQEDIVRMANAA